MRVSWFEIFGGFFSSKVGHTGLVFGVSSEFISAIARASLQISVCSGYDLCHHGSPKIESLHFDPCDLEK